MAPPADATAGGVGVMQWGSGFGAGGAGFRAPPACITCSCCLGGECIWFVAPLADHDAGGAMGVRCGVHTSAPTHNRIKNGLISNIFN